MQNMLYSQKYKLDTPPPLVLYQKYLWIYDTIENLLWIRLSVYRNVA